jgi:hypothetical protein
MMGSWPPGALGALPALDLYQRMDLERSQLSGNTSTYLNISRHTVYIYICVCDHIYIYTYLDSGHENLRVSLAKSPASGHVTDELLSRAEQSEIVHLGSRQALHCYRHTVARHGTARFSGATWVGKSPNYCKWSSIAGKTKGNHGNSMKIIYEKKVYSREKHQTRRGIVQLAMFDIPT